MIVLKVMTSAVIIGICTYLGFKKSKKLNEREYILREYIIFLELTLNQMKYMMEFLPNAFEVARLSLKTELKDAIGIIVQDMLKDNNSEKLHQSISENVGKIEALELYDKSLIISSLKNLGRTNLEGQINIIENTKRSIENQIKEAFEIRIKNSRMYKTIGTLCGVIIVVIFI